jgi:hypothetical protein
MTKNLIFNSFCLVYLSLHIIASLPVNSQTILIESGAEWKYLDDGAVVYLNSTEIERSNMPEDAINYLTLASSSVRGG